MPDRASRRELIAAMLAATGAAVGLEAGLAGPAVAAAPAPSDAALLGKALEVEALMVLGYRSVLVSGALSPDVRRVVSAQLSDEVAHHAAVRGALAQLGAPTSSGPHSLTDAAEILKKHGVSDSVTDLHSEHDCLKLLVDLESVAEGVYYTALKDLRHPGLIRVSAQIMACEAQHWTVLSGLRNPGEYVKAIPWPYVYGSK